MYCFMLFCFGKSEIILVFPLKFYSNISQQCNETLFLRQGSRVEAKCVWNGIVDSNFIIFNEPLIQ